MPSSMAVEGNAGRTELLCYRSESHISSQFLLIADGLSVMAN
jgi:hypothetical protein